jgi:regulatory protein
VSWQQKKTYLNSAQALQRLEKYCAYQERSQKQVIQKCFDLGLNEELREEVLIHLIQHDFLNEERFVNAYVRGKSRIKSWGPEKILHGLRQAGVTEKLALKAITGIQEDTSHDQIARWASKKLKSLKFTELQIEEILAGRRILEYQDKQKLKGFLATKGFPIDIQKRALSWL